MALSGGGARGIAHIGVIDVLKERGFVPAEIVGTSMGALVGALYASGTSDAFRDWILDANRKEIVKYLDFSLHEPGLIKGKKIMKKLASFLPYNRIEDLPVSYTAIATDIVNEQEVALQHGDLISAIRASISIPFVFTPVHYRDKWLVDGGVVNNLPLDYLKKRTETLSVGVWVNSPYGMELLPEKIRLNQSRPVHESKKINAYLHKIIPRSSSESKEESPGYYEILDASLHLIMSRNTQLMIRKYPPDIMIHIPRKLAGTFDFLSSEKLYRAGRFLAEKALNAYFSGR